MYDALTFVLLECDMYRTTMNLIVKMMGIRLYIYI